MVLILFDYLRLNFLRLRWSISAISNFLIMELLVIFLLISGIPWFLSDLNISIGLSLLFLGIIEGILILTRKRHVLVCCSDLQIGSTLSMARIADSSSLSSADLFDCTGLHQYISGFDS